MSDNDRLPVHESLGVRNAGGRMMRITAASGLILVAALATPAPTLAESLLGQWTATAHTPVGEVAETLTVVATDDGYSITARLVEAVPDGTPEGTPEGGPGTDIVLDGDTFSYKRTVTTPGGALEVTYTGVVSGDTFAGTVDMGFAQAPYTGVRIGDTEIP